MEKPRTVTRILQAAESWAGLAGLLLLAALPIVEIIIREVARSGITGYNGYLVHLVLLTAFFGGMITSREGRHLSIRANVGTDSTEPRGRINLALGITAAVVSAAITIAFFWGALSFLLIGFEAGQSVGIVPVRIFAAVMPLGFLVMAIRFTVGPWRLSTTAVIALAAVLIGTWLSFGAIANPVFYLVSDIPRWIDSLYGAYLSSIYNISIPVIAILIVSAFVGVPLFVVLGGTALLLFARAGGSVEVVVNEGYVLLTGNTIPAIPLFTLAGFLLSESRAGERLVRLFRALFGWLPGGMVIASVLVAAFFTTFTGASGVTILALGGLLLYVLVQSGRHEKQFATGLLTATGSIGLLFPPSLAIIVYGSIAQVSIFDLFLGGLLPGALLIGSMCAIGVVVSIRRKVPTSRFDLHEALQALKESALELLLPVVVIAVYFTGLTTLVETAAVAVVYALIVEVVIRREIDAKALASVALKAAVIIGGILMILALARGLSYYIIDVRVADLLREWVKSAITSRFAFLLLVNLVLLAAGCFMDIFSAILVIAPLIIPLGSLFGIDPVHLGIIFVANMGIGFITPPVGMNLFLASYRFGTPLPQLYRAVLPFFAIQLVIVLAITFVPWFSTAFLGGG